MKESKNNGLIGAIVICTVVIGVILYFTRQDKPLRPSSAPVIIQTGSDWQPTVTDYSPPRQVLGRKVGGVYGK